jgi:hypothetical protein
MNGQSGALFPWLLCDTAQSPAAGAAPWVATLRAARARIEFLDGVSIRCNSTDVRSIRGKLMRVALTAAFCGLMLIALSGCGGGGHSPAGAGGGAGAGVGNFGIIVNPVPVFNAPKKH